MPHHFLHIHTFYIQNIHINLFVSGTTWSQEVVYLIHNEADVEEAASRPITKRVPFIDFIGMWNLIQTMTEPPRLLKSHLQPKYFKQQIDRGLKVLVVMRNPKDTLVSFYHFYKVNRAFGCFDGSWSEFFELAKQKQLIYGDWFDFTLAWWALKDLPNVLIIKYEDMKRDPPSNIRKVAEFSGRPVSEETLEVIVQATSFSQMRKNPSVSYSGRSDFMKGGESFMRKGSTGDWKNYFTVTQNEYFDKVYKEKLAGTGLDFTFEM